MVELIPRGPIWPFASFTIPFLGTVRHWFGNGLTVFPLVQFPRQLRDSSIANEEGQLSSLSLRFLTAVGLNVEADLAGPLDPKESLWVQSTHLETNQICQVLQCHAHTFGSLLPTGFCLTCTYKGGVGWSHIPLVFFEENARRRNPATFHRVHFHCVFSGTMRLGFHKSVWIHMWCCQPLPDVVSFSKGKRASQESPGSFKAGTKAYVDQGALYVKAMLGHVTHTPQNACHSSK